MTVLQDQSLKRIWQEIINDLHDQSDLEDIFFNTYLNPSYLHSFDNEKAILVANNLISFKCIETSALKDITILFKARYQDLEPNFKVQLVQPKDIKTMTTPLLEDYETNFSSSTIQKDRTFENFVIGDCNRESQAAAYAVSLNLGQLWNPLFIYGNSGLGKTHLLMAIANYIKKHQPEKKVYYTESTKFVETVVHALQTGTIDAFKRYMYSLDVLLIDDIQFIAGKEKSHEIFFTIYEEMVNNRKQVCITSDREPKDIKDLEDRLASRFLNGLTVGIDSPEFETARAILNQKIKVNDNSIDEEGMNYIASNFAGNVRELEGALNRVLFYAIQFQPNDDVIHFETVMHSLKAQSSKTMKSGLNAKKIIRIVADYYGLTSQQIKSRNRTKNIANARHISIFLCRKHLDLPYIRIGEEFGGRDHSTIISAITKVEKQIKSDHIFEKAIHELETQIVD